ncbi:MAG TPA: pyrroline-5-carboxylate reductase [Syntrophomonadaceae bacterium]|nr:pyrroline-5-carboxylate reductase [Syntrophomonadaceae bacterium]
MDKKIAFIGTGNMGGAIIHSVCRAIPAKEVVITDIDHKKAADMAADLGCVQVDDNTAAVKAAHYIVLGVKPQVMPAVLKEIAPVLQDCKENGKQRILISIAAGLTMEKIKDILGEAGTDLPIIRILPNTPAMIGEGLMIIIAGSDVSQDEVDGLRECISACGKVVQIQDEKMADAAMVMGGCTPAFTYMFIEALADGAVTVGLTREQGYIFAAQAVKGAAAMVLENGGHPGELKDAVCSPGGSTIVGVGELEKNGFRSAAIQAVVQACRATSALGK